MKRLMPLGIIETVIASASSNGLKEIIPSTMGEPLLYPHFKEMVEIVRSNGLKLNITTNGTFPKLGATAWGKMLLPHVSDMKISVNGSTKDLNEAIMEGIDHRTQLKNIRDIVSIRDQVRKDINGPPTVTMQVTYMSSNLADLPHLLETAIELDLDRFKGHHLWITWPQLKGECLTETIALRKLWNNVTRKLHDIADTKLRPSGEKIKLDNVHDLDVERIVTRLPEDWACPFIGREAWIAWDGTFNVCCSPDAMRRTLGDFGNVKDRDFMDLWRSPDYEKLITNWGKYDVCKQCNMRRPVTEINNISKKRGC